MCFVTTGGGWCFGGGEVAGASRYFAISKKSLLVKTTSYVWRNIIIKLTSLTFQLLSRDACRCMLPKCYLRTCPVFFGDHQHFQFPNLQYGVGLKWRLNSRMVTGHVAK